MNSHVGNFCDNFQMSFETKDLLCLHSCANIKEEIPELNATISNDPLSIQGSQNDIKIKEEIAELDATFSDDPPSIHGSQNDIKIKEEIDPLPKVSEMMNEGNVDLTKAIDMVHQYNLEVHEGKNPDLKRELSIKTENVEMTNTSDIVHQYNLEVHEGKNLDIKRELMIKTENVHEEENSMVANPIIKEEVCEFKEIEIDPLSLCETVEERKIIKRKKVDYKSSALAKGLGECPKCHVSFPAIDDYIRHTIQCVYERQNVCSHCGENFASNRRLSVHLELMHEEKKEVIIEEPKIKKQKIDRFVLPVLPLPNPSEPFSKRQIFDYLYSRKITPGQSRVCEYEKNFLETVLILNEVTIDKLSEVSVEKLKSKVRSFTQWLFTSWKKRGKHWIYRKFEKKDSFDWIPELKENV